MISLRRIHHVCLRVQDVDAAAARWSIQFGLSRRPDHAGRAYLACDYEPYCLELVGRPDPGHDHTGFELARGITLDDAATHLRSLGVEHRLQDAAVVLRDPDGQGIELVAYEPAADPRPPVARSSAVLPGFHPRKLGHVNFLTGNFEQQCRFYTEGLGMKLTDWLGEDGIWFHINSDHHVMALINKGEAHFHHLAFDVVDIGQMRVALDHLGRHGRWLGWGPARHGVGGNIASYVRIVEEECFVELYCDMEQLQPGHQPRHWPDNRFSSNTWGPLPPRSYFRFDQAAIDSERESLEMLGTPLAPPSSKEAV